MPLRYLFGLAAGAVAITTAIMSGPNGAAPSPSGRNDPAPRRSIVPRIIDGDTLDIGGERVRVWGIDAPDKPERMKATARKRAAAIIEREGITCHTGERENVRLRASKMCPSSMTSYGRVNAQCSLKSTGEDFGRRMVREGYAVSYRRYDCGEYSGEMKGAEARRAGLWRTDAKPMKGLAATRQGEAYK